MIRSSSIFAAVQSPIPRTAEQRRRLDKGDASGSELAAEVERHPEQQTGHGSFPDDLD